LDAENLGMLVLKKLACSVLSYVWVALLSVAANAADPVGQVTTFASIQAPGQPEGIAIDPVDGGVWSGSNHAKSNVVIWHHAVDGALLQTFEENGPSRDLRHLCRSARMHNWTQTV
jgi:hypothetical protein